MKDDDVARLARVLVVVLTGIALAFAIFTSISLVELLLLAYAGIGQFFPGVIFGLYWKGVTRAGVFLGLLAGVGLAMVLVFSKHDPLFGVNAGFLALCVNVAVTVAVSILTPAQTNGFDAQAEPVAVASEVS